jgi:hypothetical protein
MEPVDNQFHGADVGIHPPGVHFPNSVLDRLDQIPKPFSALPQRFFRPHALGFGGLQKFQPTAQFGHIPYNLSFGLVP